MLEKNYWGLSNPELESDIKHSAIVEIDIEKALRELIMYFIECHVITENYTIEEKINDTITIKITYKYHERHSTYKSCSNFIVWIKHPDRVISFTGSRYIFANDNESNPYYKFDFNKHVAYGDFIRIFMNNIDDIIKYNNDYEIMYWDRINSEDIEHDDITDSKS